MKTIQVVGAKRKSGVVKDEEGKVWGGGGKCEGGKGSQTSFEKFLRSIPKLDPVDRTVDWLMAQPEQSVVSSPLSVLP